MFLSIGTVFGAIVDRRRRRRRYRRVGHFLRSRLFVCLPRYRNDAKMMWQFENVRKQADAPQLQEACHHRLKAEASSPVRRRFCRYCLSGCHTREARSFCKVSPLALVIVRRICRVISVYSSQLAHLVLTFLLFRFFAHSRPIEPLAFPLLLLLTRNQIESDYYSLHRSWLPTIDPTMT